MRHFDYSFLKGRIIDSRVLNYILRIRELELKIGRIQSEYPAVFVELESVAKIQSVKGSNAIEGIVTTDERILEIVNKKSAPKNHDEMEISGYRDALNLIHDGHDTIQISEKTILRLFGIMTEYTSVRNKSYKKTDNVILESDRAGNRRVRFEPIPADETETAMEQMILAYYEAKDDEDINPLLLIPCFILDFLCIHPFSDGNGRMSRLLSLLMMYREGLDIGKYISFEGQINESKRSYYEALRSSSEGWHSNENDYMPFIEEFIGTLFMCYKDLDKRFVVIGDKKINKTNRIEAAVLNSFTPVSKSELRERFPDISESMIESILSKMLVEGRVRKIGGNRNAKYLGNE